LLDEGQIRRALHLAVLTWQAEPEGEAAQKLLVQVLEAAIAAEPSFIAQSFLRQAIRQVTG